VASSRKSFYDKQNRVFRVDTGRWVQDLRGDHVLFGAAAAASRLLSEEVVLQAERAGCFVGPVLAGEGYSFLPECLGRAQYSGALFYRAAARREHRI